MQGIEVVLSRKAKHDSYLIVVKRFDEELWRKFEIDNTEVALKVFEMLDDLFHKLEYDNFELTQYTTEEGCLKEPIRKEKKRK